MLKTLSFEPQQNWIRIQRAAYVSDSFTAPDTSPFIHLILEENFTHKFPEPLTAGMRSGLPRCSDGCGWLGHVPDVRSCNKRQVGDAGAQCSGCEWMNGEEVQENPGDRTKHLSSAHRPLSPSSLVFASCISISHCQLATGWCDGTRKSPRVACWLGGLVGCLPRDLTG
ncbi:uncharacterized protein Dsimw501_GD28563 [Drosophila simulans]|nr:uncharacterized protein LOC27208410 [Drosophila simulans]KMZ08755.1 uncharacterized protein Dsimw501_GD28563 [Drosophila simulans]